ncbi:MAG TPA: transcriptional repressor LexA [Gemmatimonadota bacterium]|nr:transcriptional repressor LexA [Gemmatimonadota bacterium]
MKLTRRQREIYDYLAEFIEANGYAPSLEEIAARFGLSSVATVHEHLENLAEKGAVRRDPHRSRAIELTDGGGRGARESAVLLPLVGRVAAGQPLEAVPDDETLAVPESMLGRGETFVLKVTGDSMIDEHIADGDYVIVERRDTARSGERVVALIDEENATLKTFFREPDGRIRLQPANERLAPLYYDASRVRVQGVAIGVLRKYR